VEGTGRVVRYKPQNKGAAHEMCADCRWPYPDTGYLNQMNVNGQYTKPICGICALARVNQFHGVQLTRFKGEMAEETRQDAIKWRKNHPHLNPLTNG